MSEKTMSAAAIRRRRARHGLPWAVLLIAVLSGGALAFAGGHVGGEQTAYSRPSDWRCAPKRLNASAELPGTTLTVSPLPGSYDAMPQTQISMLGVPSKDISDMRVTGSLTGVHSGRLRAYSQGDGDSFLPSEPFKPGEQVTVQGRLSTAAGAHEFSFEFVVVHPDPVAHHPPPPLIAPGPGEVQTFQSAKWLRPPKVDVTYRSPDVEEGDIFAAPYSGASQEGPMIFNQQGQLIWMHPLPPGDKATNLQVESWEGRPVLTWWQGYIPPQGFGEGEEIVASTSYRIIKRIKAGNGDMADLHDFHLEPNHTALMTAFRTIDCNTSSVKGPREGAVTDGLFQEVDTRTGLVRREWDSVNHVPLSDSYSSATSTSTHWAFDYFHINTIDPRQDGTTLISARNTWGIYILNDRTGQIEMTIGGKKSDVKMEAGAETAYQHDVMTLPDGDLSIFDNGGAPMVHPQSRGVIVEVNPEARTDKLLATFEHPRALQAGSQGDVEPMANGDWFVGWGQEPYFTEFSATGQMLYDAHFVRSTNSSKIESYRVYKFPWSATPWYPPSVAAARRHGGLTVWASWNGATNVSSWRILGGASAERLAPLATVSSTGFETSAHVASEPWVAVQALDSSGGVIGNSKPLQVR